MRTVFRPLDFLCRLATVLSVVLAFGGGGGVPGTGMAEAQTQTRTVRAVDVSFWSGMITPSEVACWRSSGIEHVVPGTQVFDITRQQLQTAVAGGMTVDAYVVLYWDQSIPAQVETALATVAGFPIGRLWLDIEVHPGGRSVAQLEALIQQGLDACGDTTCGIYTGKWWWDAYMRGSTRFSHVPVWYAYYDQIASLDTWSYQAFGGWPFATGKQYGYGQSCGVTVDFNVMRLEPPVVGTPPTTPTGLMPPSGSTFSSGSVTMSVDADPEATRYEFGIEYWDGSAWQTYYTYEAGQNRATFWPAFADTRYRFHVRAGNTWGFSDWSAWSSFDFGVVGAVPAAPTPIAPADGAVITTSSVALQVEPVASASRYEFEIAYWDGASWLDYYTYFATTSQQRFWPAFANTAYRWRARAENGYGSSAWSSWSGFDFGNVPRLPAVPEALSPEDGAAIASGSVRLTVSPVATATAYDFQIEYSDGGSFRTYYTYRSPTSAQTFWPYYADSGYRWRSRAINGVGASDWSAWSHFDFGNVSRLPAAPVPIAPEEGAVITTSSVTLAVEPMEGVTGYELEIWYALDSEWRYYYTYVSTTGSQRFWPVYHDTYYLWRARAENGLGFGEWSEPSTFGFGDVGAIPSDGDWAYPVGDPTDGGGWYVSLGLGESWYSSLLGRWFRGHLGEDWFRASGSSLGQPVYAAAAGEVVTVRQNCGNYVDVVILRHDVPGEAEPVYSFYGHIEADGYVSVGDLVEKRQQIGVIGDPVDFNPHVHFEIKNETALVNAPFSGCSDLAKGIYISAGYSGLANDYDGGAFYDPTDSVTGNRYYPPGRFIEEHAR